MHSEPANDAPVVLQLVDVTYAWGDSTPILNIKDLAIRCGERVFLHGPSGSGKSTLISVIAGVVQPRSGQVLVLGKNLAGMRASARDPFRADHIGIIFQMFNLLPFLGARENVALPFRFSPLRRARALSRSCAREEADRLLLALGLDPARIGDQPVNTLSIGQQQRVAAARALIGKPEILIADEPSSALDSVARDSFLDLLFAECERSLTSVVFVSHDIAIKDRFDRSLRMSDIKRESHLRAI